MASAEPQRAHAEPAPAPITTAPSSNFVVGAADDTAEQQADDVARHVVDRIAARSFAPASAPSPTRLRRNTTRPSPAASLVPAGADPRPTRVRRSTAAPSAAAPIGLAGGELSEATSGRIAAAQRGGEAMPADIRRTFESAMGTDLGDVRVHAGRTSDELNADLGATAFTAGSHVFFGGGLPDVDSASGQHLMAHELAHVVQQRSEIGRTTRVRRAVGFEFEVANWTLERIDRSLTWRETSGRDPIPTADVTAYPGTIDTVGPWLFTGDQSDDGSTHIEWVMERPVEETDAGRVELANKMDLLRAENDRLIAKRNKAKIERQHEDKGDMISTRYRGQHVGLAKNVLIEPYAELKGEPQLTAGIKLDRITRIMQNLAKGRDGGESKADHETRQAGNAVLMFKGQSEVDMISGGPMAAFTAFRNVHHPGPGAPDDPSHELLGVVALMRSYLIGGGKKKSYAKGIAPFLAKTDFAKQFDMLPEADYYRANPDVFLEMVLRSAGMGMAAAGTPVFTAEITYVAQRGDMDELRRITKAYWISGIVEHGVDVLSEEGIKRTDLAGLGTHLFGFGKLGDKTDTVGATGHETDASAILEFRRIAGKLPHDRWKEFALELFDYVRQVNAGNKGTYGGEGWYG